MRGCTSFLKSKFRDFPQDSCDHSAHGLHIGAQRPSLSHFHFYTPEAWGPARTLNANGKGLMHAHSNPRKYILLHASTEYVH